MHQPFGHLSQWPSPRALAPGTRPTAKQIVKELTSSSTMSRQPSVRRVVNSTDYLHLPRWPDKGPLATSPHSVRVARVR